jgi:hypothetical protein
MVTNYLLFLKQRAWLWYKQDVNDHNGHVDVNDVDEDRSEGDTALGDGDSKLPKEQEEELKGTGFGMRKKKRNSTSFTHAVAFYLHIYSMPWPRRSVLDRRNAVHLLMLVYNGREAEATAAGYAQSFRTTSS